MDRALLFSERFVDSRIYSPMLQTQLPERKTLDSWSTRGMMLAVIGTLCAACVTSPADNSTIATRSTPVAVEGYAANSNATVTVEARQGASWVALSPTLTSSANPIPWDDRLYRFAGSIVIPNQYWSVNEFGSSATIRFIEAPGPNPTQTPLRTFTQPGLNCLYGEIGQGEDFIVAGQQCHTGSTITINVY